MYESYLLDKEKGIIKPLVMVADSIILNHFQEYKLVKYILDC